MNKID
jgi:hypothetical protein